MRVVLFGFEPFGDEPINPSGVAVRALDGRVVDGVRIDSIVLPVVYETAFPSLVMTLGSPPPLAVMGVGQGKTRFQVEMVAKNRVGARLDNSTAAKVGLVEESAPEQLASTWDADAVHAAVLRTAPPVEVALSDDAGDYLCNHTLFRVLRWCEGRVPAGFLHVPRLSVVTQDVVTRAVEAAVHALIASVRARPSPRIA